MERLKEIRASFWFYDILGYLLPGFFIICLLIIDYDVTELIKFKDLHHSINSINTSKETLVNFKIQYFFRFLSWDEGGNDFKLTTLFILLLFCYIIGHMIAAISSFFIETNFNKRFLSYPSVNLFDEGRRSWIQKRFKNYTKSFDNDFINDYKKIFKSRFNLTDCNSKELFWLSFADVSKNSPVGFSRTSHFLTLYGFNRNIAATFFIYIGLRVLAVFLFNSEFTCTNLVIMIFYALFGLIMIKNYLKLYKRQCTEVIYQFYAHNTENKNEVEQS